MKVIIFILLLFMYSPCYAWNSMMMSAGSSGEEVVNLVTNGDFATLDTTGWAEGNPGSFDASSGECVVVNGSYTNLRQLSISGIVATNTYNYSFDVTAVSGNLANTFFQTGTTTVVNFSSGVGTYTGTFIATTDNVRFIANYAGAGGFTIDNIEIWE